MDITNEVIEFFETTLETNEVFEKGKFRFTLIVSTKTYNNMIDVLEKQINRSIIRTQSITDKLYRTIRVTRKEFIQQNPDL
jgi:hypothetical protein